MPDPAHRVCSLARRASEDADRPAAWRNLRNLLCFAAVAANVNATRRCGEAGHQDAAAQAGRAHVYVEVDAHRGVPVLRDVITELKALLSQPRLPDRRKQSSCKQTTPSTLGHFFSHTLSRRVCSC